MENQNSKVEDKKNSAESLINYFKNLVKNILEKSLLIGVYSAVFGGTIGLVLGGWSVSALTFFSWGLFGVIGGAGIGILEGIINRKKNTN